MPVEEADVVALLAETLVEVRKVSGAADRLARLNEQVKPLARLLGYADTASLRAGVEADEHGLRTAMEALG